MLIWSVLGILGCVVLDQLTKYFAQLYLQPVGTMPFIPGIMELRFVLNDGAAFSSFAGARLFLILFTGIAIAALAVYLFWKKPPKRLERTALVLLIGGGLGNLIDRVRTGVVVDFFATTFVDFAVFNVADCFVCVGAAMLILYVVLEERKKSGEPERKGSETEHGTS